LLSIVTLKLFPLSVSFSVHAFLCNLCSVLVDVFIIKFACMLTLITIIIESRTAIILKTIIIIIIIIIIMICDIIN